MDLRSGQNALENTGIVLSELPGSMRILGSGLSFQSASQMKTTRPNSSHIRLPAVARMRAVGI